MRLSGVPAQSFKTLTKNRENMATPRKKNPEKAGAKKKYKKSFDKIAHRLCLLGATDKEIAAALDVSESTINNWKKEFPTFLESVKGGKMMADAKVAEGLYKRAVGMDIPDDKVHWPFDAKKDAEGNPIPVIVKGKKHLPPDPGAAMNWLNNRQPDKWGKNAGIGEMVIKVRVNGEEVD